MIAVLSMGVFLELPGNNPEVNDLRESRMSVE
jgi:hypothetical protein